MSEMTGEQTRFAEELRGPTEALIDRHLALPAVIRPWAPHYILDFGTGQSFNDRPWTVEDYPLPEAVRSAILVGLETEDNAPHYTSMLDSLTPEGHPNSDWTRIWTQEEGKHSYAIRAWAHMSRAVDPDELEAGRRQQMSKGIVPRPPTLADLLAYTSFQEPATQISHRNTGRNLGADDKVGKRIFGLIAGDETRHGNFYRDLALAGFEVDPSMMMRAAARQIMGFEMPGKEGIPKFVEHAKRISKAGIYNLSIFKNLVLDPVIEAWDIEHLEGLDADGDIAREQLMTYLERLGRVAARYS